MNNKFRFIADTMLTPSPEEAFKLFDEVQKMFLSQKEYTIRFLTEKNKSFEYERYHERYHHWLNRHSFTILPTS